MSETRQDRMQTMLEEAKADVERVEENRTALDVNEKERVTMLRAEMKERRQKYFSDRKAMTDQLKGFRHEVALIAGSLKEHKPVAVAPAVKKARKTRDKASTEELKPESQAAEVAAPVQGPDARD